MIPTILPVFAKFQDEGEVIGHLLAGYGEIELKLCFCVSVVRDDFNMVFKSMFRPRGESQRIDIADAIGREPYHELKLGTPFEEAVAAVRYCLTIRNQYAHCQWHDDLTGTLAFVDMEQLAKANRIVRSLRDVGIKHLTLALLREQEAYFVHTAHCLDYLNFEGRLRRGDITGHGVPSSKKAKRPLLCSS